MDDIKENYSGDISLPPARLNIFISYRSDPDASLASALRRLIEGAIEPQPNVFVSGEGGLRPSNIGFKRQLQAAAQTAHAFVAIITNASKDREWIFFEAGAAWGRDMMYAPVLVGARPEDLPSSIGDYQALNSQSKDDMLRLMNSLVEGTGAEVKDRFGQRYQVFGKLIGQYLRGDLDDNGSDPNHAFMLAVRGDSVQAAEEFDQLERSAIDAEERCYLRILRLRAQRKVSEFQKALSQIEVSLRETSWFNLTMALEVDRPQVKADFLRRAITIGAGRAAEDARLHLALLESELGEKRKATTSLLEIIRSDKGGEFSEKASGTLVDISPHWHPFQKLMAYLAGLAGSRSDGYRWISSLALSNEWRNLHLYCSSRVDFLEETGSSANARGLARESCGLRSLAFEAFSRSASQGVSVARYNMANLVNHGATPGAALEILGEHVGHTDSADPGYPYRVRSETESSLQGERETEKSLLRIGELQFKALWALSEKLLATSYPEALVNGFLLGNAVNIKIEGGKPLSSLRLPDIAMAALHPFDGLLYAMGGFGSAIIVVGPESAEGVFFTNFSDGTDLEWLVWSPALLAEPSLAPEDKSLVGSSQE